MHVRSISISIIYIYNISYIYKAFNIYSLYIYIYIKNYIYIAIYTSRFANDFVSNNGRDTLPWVLTDHLYSPVMPEELRQNLRRSIEG